MGSMRLGVLCSTVMGLWVTFIFNSVALNHYVDARMPLPPVSLATVLQRTSILETPRSTIGAKMLESTGFFRFSATACSEIEPDAHSSAGAPSGPFSRFRLLSRLTGGYSNKKKLLILMSDTGGGHRSSAQALDQALKEQYPGRVDVKIMDIWTEHGKWPFNQFVPMYRFLAKRPLLWRGFYNYGIFPPTRMFTELDSQRACYQNFKRAIETENPDFVVSVHPLCQLMPISIIREMNKRRVNKPRIPFVTIVTDLGSAHPCWFDRRADAVYVPSVAVRDLALRNHVPPSRILMKGLPIRPPFWRAPAAKSVLRRALGLVQDAKTVLLMGGGDGVGGLDSIASEVARGLQALDFKTQLVVVCGHNQKLREQLVKKLISGPGRHEPRGPTMPSRLGSSISLPWKLVNRVGGPRTDSDPSRVAAVPSAATSPHGAGTRSDRLSVAVRGFVQNVDEFMGAADLLVTKAGPGTIAEAMTRGLPLVLSSYLPGQEEGNVPYVVEGGFGVYTGNSPKRIAEKVTALMSDDAALQRMSSRAKQLSRPDATRAIAADIATVLLSNK